MRIRDKKKKAYIIEGPRDDETGKLITHNWDEIKLHEVTNPEFRIGSVKFPYSPDALQFTTQSHQVSVGGIRSSSSSKKREASTLHLTIQYTLQDNIDYDRIVPPLVAQMKCCPILPVYHPELEHQIPRYLESLGFVEKAVRDAAKEIVLRKNKEIDDLFLELDSTIKENYPEEVRPEEILSSLSDKVSRNPYTGRLAITGQATPAESGILSKLVNIENLSAEVMEIVKGLASYGMDTSPRRDTYFFVVQSLSISTMPGLVQTKMLTLQLAYYDHSQMLIYPMIHDENVVEVGGVWELNEEEPYIAYQLSEIGESNMFEYCWKRLISTGAPPIEDDLPNWRTIMNSSRTGENSIYLLSANPGASDSITLYHGMIRQRSEGDVSRVFTQRRLRLGRMKGRSEVESGLTDPLIDSMTVTLSTIIFPIMLSSNTYPVWQIMGFADAEISIMFSSPKIQDAQLIFDFFYGIAQEEKISPRNRNVHLLAIENDLLASLGIFFVTERNISRDTILGLTEERQIEINLTSALPVMPDSGRTKFGTLELQGLLIEHALRQEEGSALFDYLRKKYGVIYSRSIQGFDTGFLDTLRRAFHRQSAIFRDRQFTFRGGELVSDTDNIVSRLSIIESIFKNNPFQSVEVAPGSLESPPEGYTISAFDFWTTLFTSYSDATSNPRIPGVIDSPLKGNGVWVEIGRPLLQEFANNYGAFHTAGDSLIKTIDRFIESRIASSDMLPNQKQELKVAFLESCIPIALQTFTSPSYSMVVAQAIRVMMYDEEFYELLDESDPLAERILELEPTIGMGIDLDGQVRRLPLIPDIKLPELSNRSYLEPTAFYAPKMVEVLSNPEHNAEAVILDDSSARNLAPALDSQVAAREVLLESEMAQEDPYIEEDDQNREDEVTNTTPPETAESLMFHPVLTEGLSRENILRHIEGLSTNTGRVQESWVRGSKASLRASQAALLRSLLEEDILSDMRISFPSFNILLVDFDNPLISYTDYYQTKSVNEIHVVRKEDHPVDVAYVSFNNANRQISNSHFLSILAELAELESFDVRELDTITEQDHRDFNFPLTQGSQVSIFLGYGNQYENLERVLNGIVREIDGESTIDCVIESYGVELLLPAEAVLENSKNGVLQRIEPGLILRSLVRNDYLTFFGSTTFDFRVIMQRRALGIDPEIQSHADIIRNLTRAGRNELALNDTSRDINIFLPFRNSDPTQRLQKFDVSGYTIWRAIQDLALMYPGYVAKVLPYDDRVTLYFGPEDGYYYFTERVSAVMGRDKLLGELIGKNISVELTQFGFRRLENVPQFGFHRMENVYVGTGSMWNYVIDYYTNYLNYLRSEYSNSSQTSEIDFSRVSRIGRILNITARVLAPANVFISGTDSTTIYLPTEIGPLRQWEVPYTPDSMELNHDPTEWLLNSMGLRTRNNSGIIRREIYTNSDVFSADGTIFEGTYIDKNGNFSSREYQIWVPDNIHDGLFLETNDLNASRIIRFITIRFPSVELAEAALSSGNGYKRKKIKPEFYFFGSSEDPEEVGSGTPIVRGEPERISITVPSSEVYVVDGDTIRIPNSYLTPNFSSGQNDSFSIRLYGIDTKETQITGSASQSAASLNSPLAREATKVVRDLISSDGDITIELSLATDSVGRGLGLVFVGDTCVNTEIVERGLSEYFPLGGHQHLHNRFVYAELTARYNALQDPSILSIWSNVYRDISSWSAPRNPDPTLPDYDASLLADIAGRFQAALNEELRIKDDDIPVHVVINFRENDIDGNNDLRNKVISYLEENLHQYIDEENLAVNPIKKPVTNYRFYNSSQNIIICNLRESVSYNQVHIQSPIGTDSTSWRGTISGAILSVFPEFASSMFGAIDLDQNQNQYFTETAVVQQPTNGVQQAYHTGASSESKKDATWSRAERINASPFLRPKLRRTLAVQNRNAGGHPLLPLRMGSSLLRLMMKRLYDGQITVVGDPTVKPGDIAMLDDIPSQTDGIVEVGEVIHHFSIVDGFITTFVPRLATFPNDRFSGFSQLTLATKEFSRRFAWRNTKYLRGFFTRAGASISSFFDLNYSPATVEANHIRAKFSDVYNAPVGYTPVLRARMPLHSGLSEWRTGYSTGSIVYTNKPYENYIADRDAQISNILADVLGIRSLPGVETDYSLLGETTLAALSYLEYIKSTDPETYNDLGLDRYSSVLNYIESGVVDWASMTVSKFGYSTARFIGGR